MAATGDMVKDPVCGTYVPADATSAPGTATRSMPRRKQECRDKFVKRIEASRTQAMEQGKARRGRRPPVEGLAKTSH